MAILIRYTVTNSMAQKIGKVSVITDDAEPYGLYLTLYKSKRWNKLVITVSRTSNAKFKGAKFCKQISEEVAI